LAKQRELDFAGNLIRQRGKMGEIGGSGSGNGRNPASELCKGRATDKFGLAQQNLISKQKNNPVSLPSETGGKLLKHFPR
jgi:hypothetical protein